MRSAFHFDRIMHLVVILSACLITLLFVALSIGRARAADPSPRCELARAIVFSGYNWESSSFHNAVARYIIENGYGCRTESLPGSTILLLNGLIRGDVDISMEIWSNSIGVLWEDALESQKVVQIGINFPDATQGWFVPRYLVEGDDAPAKTLRKVSDLPRFKKLFLDPEQPSKGRFYNCSTGWTCEVINTRKLHAYGFNEHYNNFRPGTGAALVSAIESALKRRKPVLFFYWEPSSLLGRVGDQLLMLEEAPYDPEIWQEVVSQRKPSRATAYPKVAIPIGVSRAFAAQAPALVEFLSRYSTTTALINAMLARMQEDDLSSEETALYFLKNRLDVWESWVPDDVARRVHASLADAQ